MNKSNVFMPDRERFLAICRGKRPGDLSILDWFQRHYEETPKEWIKQGAPKEILSTAAYNRYFQFDHLYPLDDIISEHNRADLMEQVEGVWSPKLYEPTPPVVPVFEVKVIKEDERHRIETTYGGQTVEILKEFPWRMPKYLDHPVKDRATWNEYKKRLDPYTPERWPSDWSAYVEKVNNEDCPTMLLLEGFFNVLRYAMGTEGLLYMFYDDPSLIEDMMDHILYFEIVIAKRAVRDLRIDTARFSEDMGYKSGSLISPDMFKKFMIPRYKQITDLLRSNGVDILQMDSDGNINELIPIWFDECGINLHWPLEVAAGMDGVDLRKKYGKEITLGGNIDKRVFAKGKDAIRKEVLSKVPFLVETGGYFPGIDHAVPPDVSFEDFRYFINLLREIGGMEKLPE